jgi:DNA-binding cell septation regulator SpoVG
MNITAQMKINENMADSSEVASGFVELENCIKFPIKVRKYFDKTSEQEKMFVSYPQRKTDKGYFDVIVPDKGVQKEIETYVLNQMKESLLKRMETSPVSDVKVKLSENDNMAVPIRGIASIKVAGITINGITIKEGNKGMFVQMPQYKSNDEYHDYVYGTNKIMQTRIKETVLYEYEKELEKTQLQESVQKQEQVNQQEKHPDSNYHRQRSHAR